MQQIRQRGMQRSSTYAGCSSNSFRLFERASMYSTGFVETLLMFYRDKLQVVDQESSASPNDAVPPPRKKRRIR